jgi:hypothetical protein
MCNWFKGPLGHRIRAGQGLTGKIIKTADTPLILRTALTPHQRSEPVENIPSIARKAGFYFSGSTRSSAW